MSGHNKWSTIKHRKGAQDAKRGKVFTKLIKELTVSARLGGGDPGGNPRLRAALSAARAANMPKDNIDRAIKKGTGELEGVDYVEVNYEGYGPEGVALLIETLTDNSNRTVSEVRGVFHKRHGKMGEPGSVAWMFEQKGEVKLDKAVGDFEALFELALEAGAEDVVDGGDTWNVMTSRDALYAVSGAIEEHGHEPVETSLVQVPQTVVEITDVDLAHRILGIVEAFEDLDDVQKVWANFDFTDDVAAALAED
ncbi:MAG: YebC/PmpR family DNA-binding transcriptional regulator [Deltaproteobacteria bacterium]|nr:MAG: YebC/PmpR family DNA-binding transcriptional regulator [Deltaproteobacteria bacterium]